MILETVPASHLHELTGHPVSNHASRHYAGTQQGFPVRVLRPRKFWLVMLWPTPGGLAGFAICAEQCDSHTVYVPDRGKAPQRWMAGRIRRPG
jgi:hypothetical protein